MKTALEFPRLYSTGLLGLDLNWKKMLESLVLSFIHGCIVLVVPFTGLRALVASDGTTTDGLYAWGTLVYSCLIMLCIYRALMLSSTWNLYTVVFALGSVLGYGIFLLLYRLDRQRFSCFLVTSDLASRAFMSSSDIDSSSMAARCSVTVPSRSKRAACSSARRSSR